MTSAQLGAEGDDTVGFPFILRGPSGFHLQPRWSPGFAPGRSPRPDVLAMEDDSETAMAPGSADSASVPSTPPTARQDEGLSPTPIRADADADHLAMPSMTAMPPTMLRWRPRRLRPRPRRIAPNGTHDGLAARFPHMSLAEATPGASDFVPIQGH